jgi:hypothetical protein
MESSEEVASKSRKKKKKDLKDDGEINLESNPERNGETDVSHASKKKKIEKYVTFLFRLWFCTYSFTVFWFPFSYSLDFC